MANNVYPKWKQALITGAANAALNGSGATGVYAALVDTNVTAYSALHEFYSSIASAVVGTDQEIGATKTFTDGIFKGADVTWPTVTGGICEAIVLYVKNAGANSTWRLVAYIDDGVLGLPVTPNGGNITATWNASGIFKL